MSHLQFLEAIGTDQGGLGSLDGVELYSLLVNDLQQK